MLARKSIKLKAVHPNAGLEKLYKRKLIELLDCMHKSIAYWVLASYKANPPAMIALAQDATSSAQLNKTMAALKKRWLKNYDQGSKELARYFAKSVAKRTDAQLKAILKQAGFSIDFTMTRAQRDIAGAVVHENVALIKSIPEQYLKNVEGAVMRSVQKGMDVGGLQAELQKTYHVSRKRASLIARDQNSKANSSFDRCRQLELGVEKAVWIHSHGGKKPRPSHLANDGKVYDVSKGWFDPDEQAWIQPGELINCRCVSEAIIPGFV